jgi:Cupin superfamily protein
MTTVLQIDPSGFETHFARAPYAIHHALVEHPLLALERIAQLADALPAAQVEHNLGKVPELLPGGEAPRLDASPGEIARGIHTNGCWMVLKNIETDPDYGSLLHGTLDEVVPLVGDREGEMRRREGFIFLSAPDSVTPAHVDPEHNFLLQVSGTKTMVVGRFPDERTRQVELERQVTGGHRNVEAMFGDAQEFPLGPGDGVYMPVYAPHLVRNGPDVSISLSITWRTPRTDTLERAHAANAALRRLGLSPASPGRRPRADAIKAGVARGVRGVAGRIRR